MDREQWKRLAQQAARDPSRASQIAGILLERVQTESRTNGMAPEGYLLHGAHTFEARARDVQVEAIQTLADPNAGVPIWQTNNQAIPIKLPFDSLIIGAAGWASTRIPVDGDGVVIPGFVTGVPLAKDGRDLFSVQWELDGQVSFVTDGRAPRLQMASNVVGTRRIPRMMAWTLRRNQTIGVKVRNLWNAILSTLPTNVDDFPVLAEATIAFYAINLEQP